MIFLSDFKYFLIKLLNLIKYDHLHALNADVLYYLLNIGLSDMLYISIIFKVFKVVFIVMPLMRIFLCNVGWRHTVASMPNLGCLLGMDGVCAECSDSKICESSHLFLSLGTVANFPYRVEGVIVIGTISLFVWTFI